MSDAAPFGMLFRVIFYTLFVISLGSCASALRSNVQTITLKTPLVEAAQCTLKDDEGHVYRIDATPGTVRLHTGYGNLNVACQKFGYKKTLQTVKGNLGRVVYSNVMHGVLEYYPDTITVWMEPSYWRDAQEKKDWEEAVEQHKEKGREESHQCRFSSWKNC